MRWCSSSRAQSLHDIDKAVYRANIPHIIWVFANIEMDALVLFPWSPHSPPAQEQLGYLQVYIWHQQRGSCSGGMSSLWLNKTTKGTMNKTLLKWQLKVTTQTVHVDHSIKTGLNASSYSVPIQKCWSGTSYFSASDSPRESELPIWLVRNLSYFHSCINSTILSRVIPF